MITADELAEQELRARDRPGEDSVDGALLDLIGDQPRAHEHGD